MERQHCFCETPLGLVKIEANELGICGVSFADCETETIQNSTTGRYLDEAKKQLLEYFARTRKEFDVPLIISGSEFQTQVWNALRKIPYGETRTYQQIAQEIGHEKAVRAVGMANGCNPILILVPCHRVIGKDGTLVGYASGIERKKYLLDLEAANDTSF